MVKYKCSNCQKEFDNTSSFNDHKNNKHGCEKDSNINKVKIRPVCPGCGKDYCRQNVVNAHMKTCPACINMNNVFANNVNTNNGNANANNANVNGNNVNNAIISNNNGPVHVVNNIQNVTILSTTKIVVVPCLSPYDLMSLSINDIDSIFNSDDNIYVAYFKFIHCDPKKSNYHNMCYVDEDTLLVYIDHGWKRRDSKGVLYEVIKNVRNSMIKYSDYAFHLLDEYKQEKLANGIVSLQVGKKTDPLDTLLFIRNTIMQNLKDYKEMHSVTYNLVMTYPTRSSFKLQRNNYPKYTTSIIPFYNMEDSPEKSTLEEFDSSSSENKLPVEKSTNKNKPIKKSTSKEFDSNSSENKVSIKKSTNKNKPIKKPTQEEFDSDSCEDSLPVKKSVKKNKSEDDSSVKKSKNKHPRKLTESVKKRVAGRQNFECANKPGTQLEGLENTKCPMWQNESLKGNFNESGYEIDHIIEFCITQDDSESNLQALCLSCHRIKTNRFKSANPNRFKSTKPNRSKSTKS